MERSNRHEPRRLERRTRVFERVLSSGIVNPVVGVNYKGRPYRSAIFAGGFRRPGGIAPDQLAAADMEGRLAHARNTANSKMTMGTGSRAISPARRWVMAAPIITAISNPAP